MASPLDSARMNGGILDRSDWAKIDLVGADAATFLNNYTTQHLKDLPVGRGLATVITTWKGTMVDWVWAGRTADRIRLVGHPGRGPAIVAHLDKYLLGVDASLSDVTDADHLWMIFGPHSETLLSELTGESGPWELHQPRDLTIAGTPVTVWRTWEFHGPAFYVRGARAVDAAVGEAIARAGAAKGVLPVAPKDAEILRLEAGIPAAGHEIGEDVNPWEARLADAVHMAKGCYLGQEVVARLANYDKVQRYLIGFRFDPGVQPPEGAIAYVEQRKVGTLTSAAPGIGLGFIKGNLAEPGRTVTLRWEGGEAAATLESRHFWLVLEREGLGARHSR